MSSYRIKVVLLGATRTGKTSISNKYVTGDFSGNGQLTVGVSFLSKSIKGSSGQTYQFEIWDTAGQERYKSVTMSYIRDAHCILCVYDLANDATAQQAIEYAEDVVEKLEYRPVVIMVGNKSDLNNKIPEAVEEFAKKSGFLCFSSSAKTGENIDTIFNVIAKSVTSMWDHFPQNNKSVIEPSVPLESEKASKCC